MNVEKRQLCFLIGVFVIGVLTLSVVYTLLGTLRSASMSAPFPLLLFTVAPIVFLLLIVPNRLWRYSFSFALISAVLEYSSKYLFSISMRWAQLLAFLSLLFLAVAFLFVYRFKKAEIAKLNMRVLGNPISLVIKLVLALALIIAVLYFSSK